MNIDHIIPSTLKVIASENLNIENDLLKDDSEKTLSELLNEKKQEEEHNKETEKTE